MPLVRQVWRNTYYYYYYSHVLKRRWEAQRPRVAHIHRWIINAQDDAAMAALSVTWGRIYCLCPYLLPTCEPHVWEPSMRRGNNHVLPRARGKVVSSQPSVRRRSAPMMPWCRADWLRHKEHLIRADPGAKKAKQTYVHFAEMLLARWPGSVQLEQGREKKFANVAKLQPGRARQKS